MTCLTTAFPSHDGERLDGMVVALLAQKFPGAMLARDLSHWRRRALRAAGALSFALLICVAAPLSNFLGTVCVAWIVIFETCSVVINARRACIMRDALRRQACGPIVLPPDLVLP